MKSIAAALLLAIAISASGQTRMTVDPIITNPHRSVDVTFGDFWGSGCPPDRSSVTVSGNTINITFTGTSLICTANVVRWRPTIHLGTFAPGVYDIVATVPQLKMTLGRAQLIVRDMDDVHFVPQVIIGSLPAVAWTDDDRYVQSVTIDGVTVPVRLDGNFIPPPHAPGTVDVTVGFDEGPPTTMKAALTYDDAAAPPDARFFEPVFIPISYSGSGAFGTSWITTTRVASKGAPVYFRTPLPCRDCSAMTTFNAQLLDTNNDPSGILLYALRETTAGLTVQSRIRELTRGTIGASVPIAREADFTLGTLIINDVRVAPNSRTTLRVRTLGDVPAGSMLIVTTFADSKLVPLICNSAALDITSLSGGKSSFNLLFWAQDAKGLNLAQPMWGFVTVTDDATQQVIILAP